MNDYPTSEMPAAYYYYDANAAARNLEARVLGLPQARRSPMVRVSGDEIESSGGAGGALNGTDDIGVVDPELQALIEEELVLRAGFGEDEGLNSVGRNLETKTSVAGKGKEKMTDEELREDEESEKKKKENGKPKTREILSQDFNIGTSSGRNGNDSNATAGVGVGSSSSSSSSLIMNSGEEEAYICNEKTRRRLAYSCLSDDALRKIIEKIFINGSAEKIKALCLVDSRFKRITLWIIEGIIEKSSGENLPNWFHDLIKSLLNEINNSTTIREVLIKIINLKDCNGNSVLQKDKENEKITSGEEHNNNFTSSQIINNSKEEKSPPLETEKGRKSEHWLGVLRRLDYQVDHVTVVIYGILDRLNDQDLLNTFSIEGLRPYLKNYPRLQASLETEKGRESKHWLGVLRRLDYQVDHVTVVIYGILDRLNGQDLLEAFSIEGLKPYLENYLSCGIEQGLKCERIEKEKEEAISSLLESAINQDIQNIKKSLLEVVLKFAENLLLKKETDANITNEECYAILLIAIQKNQPVVLNRMLRRCQLEIEGAQGRLLLEVALELNRVEIVKLLLDKGVPFTMEVSFQAIKRGRLGLIRVLLEEGRVNDGEVHKSLILALEKTDNTIVDKLTQEQLDELILISVEKGNYDLFIRLLQKGGSVNANDEQGAALHRIIKRWAFYGEDTNYMSIIQHILKCKERDLETTDNLGRTALHIAAFYGNWKAVSLFIKKGSRIDSRCYGGNTVLSLVVAFIIGSQNIREAEVSIIIELLKAGSRITAGIDNFKAPDFESFFNKIMRAEDICLFFLQSLIDNKLVSNLMPFIEENEEVEKMLSSLRDDGVNSETDLYQATLNEDINSMQLLLQRGVNIDALDPDGWTALHHAVMHGNILVILELLNANANANIQNYAEETPLHLASRNENENLEIVRLLLERGANLALPDEDGSTALHEAARVGNVGITQLLLERGADRTALDGADGDENRLTPLDYAQAEEQQEIIDLLLNYFP